MITPLPLTPCSAIFGIQMTGKKRKKRKKKENKKKKTKKQHPSSHKSARKWENDNNNKVLKKSKISDAGQSARQKKTSNKIKIKKVMMRGMADTKEKQGTGLSLSYLIQRCSARLNESVSQMVRPS